MKRAEIRKFVAGTLAALGYPREWYEWPKHKPGQLYLLIEDAIQVLRLPAPMPKYKLRAALAKVPRRGPALVYKRVTSASWRQPDLEGVWARPEIQSLPSVGVTGNMGDTFAPPTRAQRRERR